MNALDAHARAHDARRLARDLLDADAATRAMSVASRSDASGTPPTTSARARLRRRSTAKTTTLDARARRARRSSRWDYWTPRMRFAMGSAGARR